MTGRVSSQILQTLVVGYVVLLPYQFEMGNGLNFAPADCLILLVPVLALGSLKYRSSVWSGWHVGIAAAFAAASLVASLRFGSLQQYELLNKDAGLLLPFLSYAAITSTVDDWKDVHRILRAFTIAVAGQNLICVSGFLLSYFVGFQNLFARYGGLRLSGMLLDPNAYGGLLVTAFVIGEGASESHHPLFGKRTLWFFRVTLGMGILFTFSRSAWIALGLALFVFAVFRTGTAMRLAGAALVAAPLLLVLMGSRFVPMFEEMASRPKQVQGRFDLIHDAAEAFARHPLLGGGLGSFRLSEGEIAHNTAMWFLADFGILGIIALTGFLTWFFVRGWLAWRSAAVGEKPLALALLMAHTAMFGLAMGIEAFYQRQWWVVLALIAASYRLVTRSDRPWWDFTKPGRSPPPTPAITGARQFSLNFVADGDDAGEAAFSCSMAAPSFSRAASIAFGSRLQFVQSAPTDRVISIARSAFPRSFSIWT
jgi:putative inorganic carbon (HCO3(-)) transporter